MTKHNEGYALTLQIFRFILLFIAAIALGVSCSTKKSTIGGGAGVPGGLPSYSGGDPTGLISSVIQQTCPSGVLPPMYYYAPYTPTNTTLTTLMGPFNPGSSYNTGFVDKAYVGRSGMGDVIVVRKIINGSAVVGYDIELNMCIYQNLIAPGRTYSDFQAPNGITIDLYPNCSLGDVVIAKDTTMIVGPTQFIPNPAMFATTFSYVCGPYGQR